mgnify:CR=1 FL=1
MEIKIPKEVHQHRETIFFGLSTRQFLCSALAVGAAVGVYLMFKGVVGACAHQAKCRYGNRCGPRGRDRLFPLQRPDL